MVTLARYAPKLDPSSVARLRAGRVPVNWLSCGYCAQCGPVLLPEAGWDYGELPTCPWCLVRQAGGRLPSLGFVRARLRERWVRLPAYFATPASACAAPGSPVSAVPAVPDGSSRRVRESESVLPEPEWIPAAPTPPVAPVPVPTASPSAPVALADGSATLEDAPHDPLFDPALDPFEDIPDWTYREYGEAPESTASTPDADSVGHIREVPHSALDRTWIETQIGRCDDPRQRAALRRRYGERYQAAFDAEPVPHRKEGKARFAANTDLREYVEGLGK